MAAGSLFPVPLAGRFGRRIYRPGLPADRHPQHALVGFSRSIWELVSLRVLTGVASAACSPASV